MGAQHKRPGTQARMERRRRAVGQLRRELNGMLTIYGEGEGIVQNKREVLERTEAKIAGVPFCVFTADAETYRALAA